MKLCKSYCFVNLCTALIIFFASTHTAVSRRQPTPLPSKQDTAYYEKRLEKDRSWLREQHAFNPEVDAETFADPKKWATTFVTIYASAYVGGKLTVQQRNDAIDTISAFLIDIKNMGFVDARKFQDTLEQLPRILQKTFKESIKPLTPFQCVVTTANILRTFIDPFEFDGNYGPTINPIREKVFKAVVSKEALAKAMSDDEIKKSGLSKKELVALGTKKDKEHGPTLAQVIPQQLMEYIIRKLKTLKKSSEKDVDAITTFIKMHANQKIFYFLRNNPPRLLILDQALKDDAETNEKPFTMPILSSSQPLIGRTNKELKEHLVDAVFTDEVLQLAEKQFAEKEARLKKSIDELPADFLTTYLETAQNNNELHIFYSPAGQAFLYWLYQALNLDLVFADDPSVINQVNNVKESFTATLGDPKRRASLFKEKIIAAQTKVLFTQECDKSVLKSLTINNLFLSIKDQNFKDGTVVLLKSDFWQPDYELIPFEDYDGYKKGELTAILATAKTTQQKFLLAACHGSSTRPEDGRLQIRKIVEKVDQLINEHSEPIYLIIGIDANTKTRQDVNDLKQLLDSLGLIATHVGPTTIKRRMVTVQHAKAGKFAVDEEDYIIVKKDQLSLHNATINFTQSSADPNIALPNMENQSDHYPVSALVEKNMPYISQKKDISAVKTPEPDTKKFTTLVAKSDEFNKKVRFPTKDTRIQVIARNNTDKQVTIIKQAETTYPILHNNTSVLLDDFLEFKKKYGTDIEKKMYKNMTRPEFINRLITKRPLVFYTEHDVFLLRDGKTTEKTAGLQADPFEEIGSLKQVSPIILDEYISYDEMQLSALLGVSTPTFFINDGNRNNKGIQGAPESYEKEGVYVGLVGARFEKEMYMEWQHIMITPAQNAPQWGYGKTKSEESLLLSLWKKFYGTTFATFEQAQKDTSGRYVKLSATEYFDTLVYKKRMRMVIEPFLYDAQQRGKDSRKNVYIHAVGLGLGVWKKSDIQTQLLLDVYAEVIQDSQNSGRFSTISDITFAHFDGNNLSCGGARNNEKIPGSSILVHFSKREPAARLTGVNEGKLLVAQYAWDANSYPGNEYWLEKLSASGDPAAACCSTISELQNPEINPYLTSNQARSYGVSSQTKATRLKGG